MKSVAKIILGFSLLALAACSGKGSGESRINNVDNDGNDSPSVIENEDTPAGSSGSIVACKHTSGAFCAETTDKSIKSECNEENEGILLDKCPAGGKKCDIGDKSTTFYVYQGEMTCEMLIQFMSMDDEED
jgi:hypothetical protein